MNAKLATYTKKDPQAYAVGHFTFFHSFPIVFITIKSIFKEVLSNVALGR